MIMSQDRVTRSCLKIVSQDRLPKLCLRIVSQFLSVRIFGFSRFEVTLEDFECA